jgi:pimeloyl-ACP methyl ester carboxylesterase
MAEPHPTGVTEVPMAWITCTEDRTIDPDWQRWAARERIGVEAELLQGGHSPFLTRPRELAALLDRVAAGIPA